MIGTRSKRGALGPAGMKDSMGAMDDDSAGPDAQDTGGGGATCSIPMDSLSADGTPPSVGDKVNFSIEGIVQNVSGGNAEITVNSVNGEAVGGNDGSGTPGESTSSMGDRLRKQAGANDAGY